MLPLLLFLIACVGALQSKLLIKDGMVDVMTDEYVYCIININGQNYNTTQRMRLSGLHFGLLHYDCNDNTGYMISKLECKPCGLFCFENELIDGYQQNLVGTVVGFSAGVFVFVCLYVLSRRWVRRLLHDLLDSFTKKRSDTRIGNRAKKVLKLRKMSDIEQGENKITKDNTEEPTGEANADKVKIRINQILTNIP